MVREMKVAIIGGGIAGLSAAYYLSQQANEKQQKLDILLFERENYWGGKIKTVVENGFVVEGGPDAYLVTKPWMRELCHELGLAEELQGTNPECSETFILHQGKLTSIPEGLTMTIPTQFMPILTTRLLSWPDKLRMAFDFLTPPKKNADDESLAGFISRRIGRAAYENLVGPLLSGIYAGDGDRLSLTATFPNLREMEIEHGGLIKGALALRAKRAQMHMKKNSSQSQSRSMFESPIRGLVTFVDALVQALEERGVTLRTGIEVKQVDRVAEGYQLHFENQVSLVVDFLVLATPAYVSGKLIAGWHAELAGLLSEIEHVSTATVSLAFYKKDLPFSLDGYGYIVPQHADSPALACTWTSSKWNHRAPEDQVLLRIFIGRIQDDWDLPNDEQSLIAIAQEELKQTLGIDSSPTRSWVFRWEKAMPQYTLGHPERMQIINILVAELNKLALAGNAYQGIGMPDCIHSGILAAEKIISNIEIKNREIA